MNLSQKHCVPCEGGAPPMTAEEVAKLMPQISPEWKSDANALIVREFKFNNFAETMAFVNKVADLAETEGHHPDMHVSYGKVVIKIWTHAIRGLSESDFVLAAKIDLL
jgi:4a-hydroxytetrahydrobiopterin dehydratase